MTGFPLSMSRIGSADAQRGLLGPQRQVLNRETVLVPPDDAREIVDPDIRILASQRDVRDGHLQLVRVAGQADRGVDLVEHLRDVDARCPHRLPLQMQGPVTDPDLADLDRPPVLWCVRIRRLRLHQLAEVPSPRRLLHVQRRLVETDVIEDQVSANERQQAVVEADILERDHGLAVHRDVDILHLHAEEQVAVEAANRQAAIHVVVGLANDEASQPFLEPGRLRHDHRHRRGADDQGAEESEDLKGPAG